MERASLPSSSLLLSLRPPPAAPADHRQTSHGRCSVIDETTYRGPRPTRCSRAAAPVTPIAAY
eukprot:scaffold59015_cov31-Tisochrysis_lutea.AAC.4